MYQPTMHVTDLLGVQMLKTMWWGIEWLLRWERAICTEPPEYKPLEQYTAVGGRKVDLTGFDGRIG